MKMQRGAQGDLLEQIGGIETCERLSQLFHEKIAHDAQIRSMFPGDLGPTTDRLALFLVEQLGGPPVYTARRGKQSLICRHAHLPIGADAAARWLELMSRSMEELGIATSLQKRLLDYFTETSRTLADPFLLLYDMPLEELREQLSRDPSLASACDLGRTLLNVAARRWDVPRVRLLLESGANPNSEEPKDHGPLYYATNALGPPSEVDGRLVVELLLRHGAHVDHASGPVRCTPLHMTARRGSLLLAEALLSAGADIEKGDSKGETPLRRAVNCGHEAMVVYLLSKGADRLSRDKEGRTPVDAARKPSIQKALLSSF